MFNTENGMSAGIFLYLTLFLLSLLFPLQFLFLYLTLFLLSLLYLTLFLLLLEIITLLPMWLISGWSL